MKQLLFIFFLFSFSIQSQDFSKVDDLVASYPKFTKVKDLANQIAKDFKTDKNKARAAFYWLAKNIRYNLKEYYNPKQRSYNFSYATEEEKEQKLQVLKDKIIDKTFKTKFGVCEEYAQSFKKICDLLDLEAEVIKGNVRNNPQEIGKPENTTNHAWNAVKLNDKWIILDPTWSAGFEYNGKWVKKFDNYFYNIPKDKIFRTHFPEDSIWVLRFGRMSLQEFYNQPIYGNSLLSSNAELIAPKTGILSVNSSQEIKLKFKNLDINSLIYYTFQGQRFAEKPIISMVDEITTLTFKNASKNSFLTLYINKEAALQFKTK
ncbi:MAG: transglutaminase domain-containing protein [Polaribacter sp.]